MNTADQVLLVQPPLSDITTSYPSTSYLLAHLRSRGIVARQEDWSIEMVGRLLSRQGLSRVRARLLGGDDAQSLGAYGSSFIENFKAYASTIESVVEFLRGGNPTLDSRIVAGRYLPAGPDLRRELTNAARGRQQQRFGSNGIADRARYLASVYLLDVESAIRELDPRFRLNSYAERLASSPESFDAIIEAVEDEASFLGQLIDEVVADRLPEQPPRLVGITIPFPGNVVGAFRIARSLRRLAPETRIAIGGGWVNTELRHLSDLRVFDYVDYVSLDDGERPLECLFEHAVGRRPASGLLRTYVRIGDEVVLQTDPAERDAPFREYVTPSYDGLHLEQYLAWMPGTSPVHRVWAARWNKLTLAHGCYWRKCSFCDVSLDYIQRYETQSAERIVDHIERLIADTGTTGFHWVDEAAPPALLRKVCETLIERRVGISWWSMVRFDKAFTPELADLMAAAGCVMLSGGLEVASDRVLELMKKGVTIEQVARVTRNLSEAGIGVHAFLMYGFPTQTVQETVDSLEVVRQLFEHDCIHSAFWHRFVPTIHSEVGMAPEQFGIRIPRTPFDDPPRHGLFAVDVLEYEDPTGVDHEGLGAGLSRAVSAYREAEGTDRDVREWFDFPVPGPTVSTTRIRTALTADARLAAGVPAP